LEYPNCKLLIAILACFRPIIPTPKSHLDTVARQSDGGKDGLGEWGHLDGTNDVLVEVLNEISVTSSLTSMT